MPILAPKTTKTWPAGEAFTIAVVNNTDQEGQYDYYHNLDMLIVHRVIAPNQQQTFLGGSVGGGISNTGTTPLTVTVQLGDGTDAGVDLSEATDVLIPRPNIENVVVVGDNGGRPVATSQVGFATPPIDAPKSLWAINVQGGENLVPGKTYSISYKASNGSQPYEVSRRFSHIILSSAIFVTP